MKDEACTYHCPQCSKIFATNSNLKRHMENPNIHNVPYARSRDQKRWKDHSKKVSSRQETTERMRKWRAENKDKNKQNDLRCRVYRLARQKFGEENSVKKQQFITDEINRRLGRRMLLEQQRKDNEAAKPAAYTTLATTLDELPFYCAPLHKIELPSINVVSGRRQSQSTEPSGYVNKSQPNSPSSEHSLMNEDRRQSASSMNSSFSNYSNKSPLLDNILVEPTLKSKPLLVNNTILPPMQNLSPSYDRSNFLCSQPPL